VQKDINAMWDKLAELSDKQREDIEGTRQDILQRVELRKRFAWHHAYASAVKKGGGTPDESTIEKWLEPGSDDEAPIDNFKINVAEETAAHVILHAISLDVQNELGRHSERYPGLTLRPGLHRYYAYEDVACHILGHLGKVNRKDLDNDADLGDPRRRYLPNDDIGRGGLEWLCEPALRGTLGQMTSVYGEENSQSTDQPIPGQTVHTTIDIDLQQDIQSFFASATLHDPHRKDEHGKPLVIEDHAVLHGAAVLLDVQTNQVLAMVSYPTYDLNHFDDLYAQMQANVINEPLRDRATESQLEPGSTVKPLVGLSAITAGIMKVNEGIECTGYLILPVGGKPHLFSRMGRCWVASGFAQELKNAGMTPAHHPIPFPHHGHDGNPDGFLTYSDALERSCNVYFETVADRMGMDRLTDWMGRFGLGRRTGIGIEEYKGRVPGGAGEDFGNPRATCFFGGIGQGYVAATPIQMANVAATIARGGIWMRPHLIAIDPATGKYPPVRAGTMDGPDVVDLHLDPQAVAGCKLGMINVVDGPAGTGTMAHMDNMLIAGKTGTAQAAPFKVLQKDDNGKPKIDAEGKHVYTTFEPSTPEHPNTELPWYRCTLTKDGYKLDHAWMIGFAPADHPRVAIAVLVEYGGSGGGAAADVVRFSLDACIAHGYLQPQTNVPKPPEEQPQPQAAATPAPGSELLTDLPGQR
jgi:penicillin-binding protein 2